MKYSEPVDPAYMQRVEDWRDACKEREPKGREHIGRKRDTTHCFGCRKDTSATTGRYRYYCEKCQGK